MSKTSHKDEDEGDEGEPQEYLNSKLEDETRPLKKREMKMKMRMKVKVNTPSHLRHLSHLSQPIQFLTGRRKWGITRRIRRS